MGQECYAGVHARVLLPVGIVCSVVLCLGPPAAAIAVMLKHRRKLHEPYVAQTFGFLFHKYK